MDYVVKKVEQPELPPMPMPAIPVMPQVFVLTYTKTIKDIGGNDVVVIDHEERVTMEELEAQAKRLQDQLDVLNAKIKSLTDLE